MSLRLPKNKGFHKSRGRYDPVSRPWKNIKGGISIHRGLEGDVRIYVRHRVEPGSINLVARSWRGKGSYVVSDSSIRIRIARWIEEDSTKISGILLLSLSYFHYFFFPLSAILHLDVCSPLSKEKKRNDLFFKSFFKRDRCWGIGLIHRPILSRSAVIFLYETMQLTMAGVQSCVRRKLDDQIRDIGGCNSIWEDERLDQGCNAVWT